MKIPVHNPQDHPIYVGTSMILPGETRHFDANDPALPAHLRPQPEADAAPDEPPDAIDALRALGVKQIVAEFDLLDAGELDRLEANEAASDSPRKSLLAAISEEKLKRAANADAATAGTPAGATQ